MKTSCWLPLLSYKEKKSQFIEVESMKICVLGLGQVGLPTASYILNRGLEVWGYDIKENATGKAREHGIKATTNWSEIPPADIYVVCVSTLLKGDLPDLTPVFEVCDKIAEKAEPPSLTSIESTIIPGTCRKIHNDIFKEKIALVHVPHRYWSGDSERYGVKQMRVIGAMDDKSLKAGIDFYKNTLRVPLFAAPSIEVAEMSKVAENAYRYLQIAFAEELKMTCGDLGLDFEKVREACNTKWNIEMLEARDGINGHCLPKDILYLASVGPHNLLTQSAITVDKAYRKWLAER